MFSEYSSTSGDISKIEFEMWAFINLLLVATVTHGIHFSPILQALGED